MWAWRRARRCASRGRWRSYGRPRSASDYGCGGSGWPWSVGCRWRAGGCFPVRWRHPRPGWPAGFAPLDARVWRDWPGARPLRAGELSLLGMARSLAPAGPDGAADWAAADWEMAGAPLLWRFHLYYWDWAWALEWPRRRGRPGGARRPVAILALGRHARAGTGLASVPGVAPGVDVLRSLPHAGGRRPERGAAAPRARRARGLPPPQPGNRRGRKPPHQEPEGAGRPRGVLRR